MLEAKELKERIKELESRFIQSLIEIIRIPSVIDETSFSSPFGESIDSALRTTLKICKDLGFRTYYDPEGYYGYAEIGEGEEMVGVLGHLDVVPAGNLQDWDRDPFTPVIDQGKIYGRGVQDDKGPMMAAVYAAKALMDQGIFFSKRVRFIFGTDEETLWRCMKKYNEKEEIPYVGFTPDSRFPLIYAEKGLLQVYLEAKNETSLMLQGGGSFNSVPDSVIYSGEGQAVLIERLNELGFEWESDQGSVKVLGKAAHSQVAEQGINAINRLAIALWDIGIESKTVRFIAKEIREDPNAYRIFGACEDEESGKLTFNIGEINVTPMKEQLSIDIRIPVTVDKQLILALLTQKAGEYGFVVKEHDWLKPIFISADHPLIGTLMKVYQEVTGDIGSKPIASGGATYARAIDNCVAFGAIFPHQSKMAHQPNEHMHLDDLFKAMEIYAKAIYELTR